MADWYFRGGPQKNNLQTCPGCRNLVRRGEEFCPFCARRLAAEGGVRGMLRSLMARPDSMTRILLGAMIVMFLAQLAAELTLPAELRRGAGGGLGSFLAVSSMTYIRLGSNFHPYVAFFHEYWRLLTYCFLHIGIFHILFNGWALWDLGRLAERLWGWKQLFATFILTGIVGGAFSLGWALLSGHMSNSAGASGAICGVLGLMLGAYYRNKYHVGEFLGSQLVRWAVMILVFGLVIGADNGAHLGGMISGGALGYFLPPTSHSKTYARDMKIWNALAAVSLALFLICYAFEAVFFAGGLQSLVKGG